jgi:hypothetical protein
MGDYRKRFDLVHESWVQAGDTSRTPGKRSLTSSLSGPVQRKASARTSRLPTGARELVLEPGDGDPLPAPLQAKMERSFATDFSDVRVRVDPAVSDLGARAYANGSQLSFAPGEYDPHSTAGQELVGHELAHVVQQREGRVSMPQGKDAPVNEDPGLEREADCLGALAARGETAVVSPGAASRGGGVLQLAKKKKLASSSESEGEPWFDDSDDEKKKKKKKQKVVDNANVNANKMEAPDDDARDGEAEDEVKSTRVLDDLTIHISVSDGSIDEVVVNGRPKRAKFSGKGADKGSSEGDHTTAWLVMRTAVRTAMIELAPVKALEAMNELAEATKKMPGAERTGDLEGKRDEIFSEAEDALESIQEEAMAMTDVEDVDVVDVLSLLQDFAAAYLAYRNSIALSVVFVGKADGDSEDKAMNELRGLLMGIAEGAPDLEAIHAAAARLFSAKAYFLLASGEVEPPQVPGMTEEDQSQDILEEMIDQHYRSLILALPALEDVLDRDALDEACQARAREWEAKHRKAKNDDDDGMVIEPKEKKVPKKAAGAAWKPSPGAVQIRVVEGAIDEVLVSERPPEVKFGDSKGSHTTPWVAMVAGLKTQLGSVAIDHAVEVLDDLVTATLAMPGASDEAVGNMEAKRRDLYGDACDQVVGARAKALTCLDDEARRAELLGALQEYAAAYLLLRHSLAFCAIETTSCLARTESGDMGALQRLEAGDGDVQEATAAMWSLLDEGALAYHFQEDGPHVSQDHLDPDDPQAPVVAVIPGLPSDHTQLEDLLGPAIAQHLQTMRLAYPGAMKQIEAVGLAKLVGDYLGKNRDWAPDVKLVVDSVIGWLKGEKLAAKRARTWLHSHSPRLGERILSVVESAGLASAIARIDASKDEVVAGDLMAIAKVAIELGKDNMDGVLPHIMDFADCAERTAALKAIADELPDDVPFPVT